MCLVRNEPKARNRAQVCERNVFANRTFEQKTRFLAVFGNKVDAGVDGIAWRAGAKRVSGQRKLAFDDFADAEDGLGKLGAPGTDQSSHPEDLSGANVQIDACLRVGGSSDAFKREYCGPDLA